MANFKDNFVPNTVILSSEINQNFNRLNNLFQWETLTSQVDGIKTQFACQYNYKPGNLIVFVDGIAAEPIIDVQEDGTNLFTLLFANPLEVGAKLMVLYIREF